MFGFCNKCTRDCWSLDLAGAARNSLSFSTRVWFVQWVGEDSYRSSSPRFQLRMWSRTGRHTDHCASQLPVWAKASAEWFSTGRRCFKRMQLASPWWTSSRRMAWFLVSRWTRATTRRASGEPQLVPWDTQRWPLWVWMTCSKGVSRPTRTLCAKLVLLNLVESHQESMFNHGGWWGTYGPFWACIGAKPPDTILLWFTSLWCLNLDIFGLNSLVNCI